MKSLILLLLASFGVNTVLAQTTETLKSYSPSGKEGAVEIDVTQFSKKGEDYLKLTPKLMIINTEVVKVSGELQKEFLNYVAEQNKIWQYRYLHQLCEHELAISPAQSLENQFFILRKEIHSGNIISSLLERNLQKNLQPYFSSPVCFAYRLNRSQEYDMAKMAADFSVEWVISPAVFKSDTSSGFVNSSLQLEVWDQTGDSLRFIKIFEGRGSNLLTSLENVISKAGAYLLGTIIKDQLYRNAARLTHQRGEFFQGFLSQQSSDEVKQIMADNNFADGYLGGLMNKAGDQFLGLTLKSYTPDFKEKMPNKVYKNPYPDIDVTIDMDPDRAKYKSMTYLGLKFEGEWIMKPVSGEWIYTDDPLKAKKVYMNRFSNLGLFIPDSVKLYSNYWQQGFLAPVDTASITFQHDTSKVKNWKTSLAVEKYNMAPYQGFPKFIAHELAREYTWKKSSAWRREVAETYLKDMFNDLEATRVRDVRFIDTEVRSYEMIHDYDMTKGLIAVWVEEPWVKLSLRFFYWEKDNPEELYEWTYLPKVFYNKESNEPKGRYLFDQMNKVIPWNFVRGFVDDENFWNSKVMAKENGEFKYLVKVSR